MEDVDEGFDFYTPYEELTLETIVFQGLGAASVCWENLDAAGIFQSDRAVLIGNKMVQRIKELCRDNKIL